MSKDTEAKTVVRPIKADFTEDSAQQIRDAAQELGCDIQEFFRQTISIRLFFKDAQDRGARIFIEAKDGDSRREIIFY